MLFPKLLNLYKLNLGRKIYKEIPLKIICMKKFKISIFNV